MLLSSRGSSGEGSIESGNLSHSGRYAARVGDTLLLCLNDGLLLLFDDCLLLRRSLSGEELFIQSGHISLESELFSGLNGFDLCRSSLCHCILFGNDNSLLLFGCFCCSESSIESGDFCHQSLIARIIARNALLLGLYNGLLLLFDNSLLLLGSLSGGEGRVKCVHFGLELCLLSGLGSSFFCCGTNHSLLFGTDHSIFCLRSLGVVVSGIESSDFCTELVIVRSFSSALLLCFNDSLLFSLDNNLLLFFCLCSLEFGAKSIHFGLELGLLCTKNRSLSCGLKHSLLFCLNYSMLLLGSLCQCKSSVECQNFCFDRLGSSSLCHALLLCLDNSLLLNVENSFLFFLGLSGFQCGIERIHIGLELHLLLGLNGCTGRLKHSFLFCLDNSLLFFGSSCSLNSSIELCDFSIDNGGSGGVGSENFFFCFDNSLLFCRSACCEKGSVKCHNFGLNLSFSLFGSHSGNTSALLAVNDNGGRIVLNGSSSCESLLFKCDLGLLFALKLSVDLSLGKSSLEICSFFGSLSSIQSHIDGHDICLDSCHLCCALVCFLLQLCSFFFSLLLSFDFELHLLATNSGLGICLALVGGENLLGCHSGVVGEHRSHCNVCIGNELFLVFLGKFRLNVDIDIHTCRRFLITVHQHVLDTADDVGRVVDKVCNDLYGGELFRRHGDHIHLALGGDGQKAYGNDANAGSTNTAKVFLSALNSNFCGQIQATCSDTHRELGNRNNHHAARGNDLLTNNSVRINNGAYLFQRIPDYFLDRRFVFHNE